MPNPLYSASTGDDTIDFPAPQESVPRLASVPGRISLLSLVVMKSRYLLPLAILAACQEPAIEKQSGDGMTPLDDVLVRVQDIVIEEPDTAPIGRLEDLEVLPNGKFVIVDRANSQIRVHASDGRLERLTGRFGEGPGEFRDVIDAAVDENGDIYVADFGAPRVSKFSSELRFDTIVASLPGPMTGVKIDRGRLLVGIRGQSGGATSGYLDSAGKFTPFRSWGLSDVAFPHLVQVAVDHIALGQDVLIANSVRYPIDRYDGSGNKATTGLGSPPASWIGVQPPTDALGGPAGIQNLAQWLNTFSVISGLHVIDDSLVAVTHARYHAGPAMTIPEMFRMHPYGVDLYDKAGKKIWADVALNTRILHADSLIYVETAEPPADRVITVYRLRAQ